MSKKNFKNVFLSLGANLGDRLLSINKALDLIGARCGLIIQKSNVYESEAWGFDSENRFLNMCIELKTTLDIDAFFGEIKDIENILGRVEKSQNNVYVDRFIDIDMLYYEFSIVNSNQLQIPHPKMHERRFVLEPLNEIAPDKMHPVLKKTTSEMLSFCTDVSKLNVYLGQ